MERKWRIVRLRVAKKGGKTGCRAVSAQHKSEMEQLNSLAGAAAAAAASDPSLRSYHAQRYRYFRRFDEGVWLDRESWFSVTPERIAAHQAMRLAAGGAVMAVDGFCGAGGNAIALAAVFERVLAVDMDPVKIALARHNAQLHGVAERITFVCADFMALAPFLAAAEDGAAVFLSPPWGGPDAMKQRVFDVEAMPVTASACFKAARRISPHIALFLPRHSDRAQLKELARLARGDASADAPPAVEVEENSLNGFVKGMTLYFGGLVGKSV